MENVDSKLYALDKNETSVYFRSQFDKVRYVFLLAERNVGHRKNIIKRPDEQRKNIVKSSDGNGKCGF